MLEIAIVASVCLVVIGVIIAISPVFIWWYVTRIRKLQEESFKAITSKLDLISRKLDKEDHDSEGSVKQNLAMEVKEISTRLFDMEMRQIKSMQYVCDRLADICDNTGGMTDRQETAQSR